MLPQVENRRSQRIHSPRPRRIEEERHANRVQGRRFELLPRGRGGTPYRGRDYRGAGPEDRGDHEPAARGIARVCLLRAVPVGDGDKDSTLRIDLRGREAPARATQPGRLVGRSLRRLARLRRDPSLFPLQGPESHGPGALQERLEDAALDRPARGDLRPARPRGRPRPGGGDHRPQSSRGADADPPGALDQLSFLAGIRHRLRVGKGEDLRELPACRPPPRLPRLRSIRGLRGPDGRVRRYRGLYILLVGRAPAPQDRDDRVEGLRLPDQPEGYPVPYSPDPVPRRPGTRGSPRS